MVDYFARANMAEQVIVVLLVLCSFAAWTVMIGKYLDLSRLRNMNLAFERKIAQVGRLLDINLSSSKTQAPYGVMVLEAQQALEKAPFYESTSSAQRMRYVENALQRVVSQECVGYESKMVFLGTMISGAPFLGLLGTVWGIMDAFGAMGTQASVTLQSLAPGVSGALVTTVAGLLVAIPAVFGYNFLLSETKIMVTELENFASNLADRVELELESDTMELRN
ncbi:MAG TPA: MotA/TolQ/ExbB proton channel family protein [Opitutales bacterium]|nr:MotA/TolQ/ExbB proton channel family protein [Opitutales bacterium]